MPTKDSARLLSETIPNAHMAIIDGDESGGSTGWNQYETYESGAYITKAFFGYFDLSGYTLEQKTTFIQGVMFQGIGNYGLSGLQTGINPVECRMVTTTPMVLHDFTTSSHSSWVVPGHPQTALGAGEAFSSQQVVSGSMAKFNLDVGAAIGRLGETSAWGVGASTAAEKLYYARVFRFPKVIQGSIANYYMSVPPLEVVIPIITTTEPELEYIMRLKRSTELA